MSLTIAIFWDEVLQLPDNICMLETKLKTHLHSPIPHTPPPYWLYAVIKQLWKSSISQISTWSSWEIGVHTALIASFVVFHYMLCKPYSKILIRVYNLYHISLIFKSNICVLSLGRKCIIAVFYLHFTNILHLTHHSCSRSSNTLWSASFSATSAASSA